MVWFCNRIEPSIAIVRLRRHYNVVRPYSKLGYLMPQQAAQIAIARLLAGARLQIPVARKIRASHGIGNILGISLEVMILIWITRRK